MAKRSRDKMITFWVTEDELAKINANMEKLGTSNLSAYLRKMAITGLIIRLDIPELKQIVSLMRRTSANINQMAKHINQGDRLLCSKSTACISSRRKSGQVFGECFNS